MHTKILITIIMSIAIMTLTSCSNAETLRKDKDKAPANAVEVINESEVDIEEDEEIKEESEVIEEVEMTKEEEEELFGEVIIDVQNYYNDTYTEVDTSDVKTGFTLTTVVSGDYSNRAIKVENTRTWDAEKDLQMYEALCINVGILDELHIDMDGDAKIVQNYLDEKNLKNIDILVDEKVGENLIASYKNGEMIYRVDRPNNKESDDVVDQNESSSDSSTDDIKTISSVEFDTAKKYAEEYLECASFSRKGSIEQLVYEDVISAIDSIGVDWNEETRESATSYMEFVEYNKDELNEKLEFEGFTSEQIEDGLKAVGY